MNTETKKFVDSILDNLDYLIEKQKASNSNRFIDFLYSCNLKFAKQFILEFAEKNGYGG